jgi:putative ABC transport system permease protein
VQGKSSAATIKSVAGASRRDVWSWNDPTRTFDVSFDVKGSDPARSASGSDDAGARHWCANQSAKYLPRQALFEQDGKAVVFVRQGRSFEPREVKVLDRTETLRRGRRFTGRHGSGAAQSSRRPGEGLRKRQPCATTGRFVIRAFLRDPKSQLGTGLQDLQLGLDNLRVHKLRSLLTMLGMIFGVAAVVAMLSIGAGAQQQVMAFIEQLGVRNVIVEARETTEPQRSARSGAHRPASPFRTTGSSARRWRGVSAASPRKRFQPSKMLPKPQRSMPTVYGVTPSYIPIGNLRLTAGRFFDDGETERAAPLAVLGEGAKAALFGPDEAVGQYIKVNDQWLRVIWRRRAADQRGDCVARRAGRGPEQPIYVPLWTAMLRLEDNYSRFPRRIDGIYLQLEPGMDSVAGAETIRGVLNASHRNTPDFSVIVPAALLAEQRRTQRIFEVVMVALASISLLVGGIGS